jgi:hypothetical protein
MFGGTGARVFVRTAVSSTERALSWLVLVALAGIAAGVCLKGRSYDPALFSLEARHLATPAQEQAVVDNLAGDAAEDARPEPQLDGGMITTLSGLVPQGWQRLGTVERYSADDLYVKINGRAEQYVAYDVLELTCVSMAAADGEFIDVFVYDMGTPLNAFGIFSVERAPQRQELSLGNEGYQVAASCFYYQGPFYAQVMASADRQDLKAAALQAGHQLAAALPRSRAQLWGATGLPEQDRLAGSLQYLKRDALSLSFLTNAFTATFQRGGEELSAFLAQHDDVARAGVTLAAYEEYLGTYGQIIERRAVKDGVIVIGDLGGVFDAVFQRGELVGGVAMASDRQEAAGLAAEMLQHLTEQ